MGPLELMLIVVLALIVFGPAKLPEIMGQVGRAIGDFRRATSELSDEFNRTIQAELNETKQTIEETKSALTEVRSMVDSTVQETHAAVTSLPAPTRVATPAVEANGVSHEDTAANGTPPLADTSQWSWETSPARPEGSEMTDEAVATPAEAEAPSPEALAAEEAEAQQPTDSAREKTARDELLPPY